MSRPLQRGGGSLTAPRPSPASHLSQGSPCAVCMGCCCRLVTRRSRCCLDITDPAGGSHTLRQGPAIRFSGRPKWPASPRKRSPSRQGPGLPMIILGQKALRSPAPFGAQSDPATGHVAASLRPEALICTAPADFLAKLGAGDQDPRRIEGLDPCACSPNNARAPRGGLKGISQKKGAIRVPERQQ